MTSAANTGELLQATPPAAEADTEFLAGLGRRVRELREGRGLTRKLLARDADVSERYLGQLEAGDGNGSILVLRRIAAALNATLAELLLSEQEDGADKRAVRRLLEQVPPHRLPEIVARLTRELGCDQMTRRERVALIGLRGAGKSTLGSLLAAALRVPFVEIDQQVERDAGLPLSELIALYGQPGYRRIERRCLERAVEEHRRAVIAVGGGLVAEEDTFDLLLANCFTVWLRATPEEHMARVLAQGDLRPMAGNVAAMEDLKRILAAREPSYRRADAVVDTSGATLEVSLAALRSAVQSQATPVA